LTPDIFAKWLKNQNYRVYKTESGYWYNQAPGVYQSFPYFQEICPGSVELTKFFRESGAVALRYSTKVGQPVGKISYHVISETPFTLETLPKKVRHDLQHGMEYASYEKISFEQLAEEGWKVRSDTLVRQGRVSAETKDHWLKLCNAASGLDGFEAWGAIRNQELLACVLCATIGECCQILYQQSLSEHLSYGINNALAFFVTNKMFTRAEIKTVFYGLHSLDAPASVDDFKFRMGFTTKPVRQRIVINPLLAPFFNKASYHLLKLTIKAWPGNSVLAKAEGMLRFYLQGSLPLSEQDWPKGLLKRKDTILAQAIRE